MTPPVLVAHRGFSSRHPEATRAAYQAAIDWAHETEIPLGLECDVHFSADDELICLHDLTLDRTSTSTGPAYERTVAELKLLDFGSWTVPDPRPEQRELITLRELMIMVRDARQDRIPVSIVIETKHPNERGRAVEERVAAMLAEFGWDQPGSPVRAGLLLGQGTQAVRLAAAWAGTHIAHRKRSWSVARRQAAGRGTHRRSGSGVDQGRPRVRPAVTTAGAPRACLDRERT